MELSKLISFLREDFTRWLAENPSRDVRITSFERGERGAVLLREQLTTDTYLGAQWPGPFYVFDPSTGDSFSAETKAEVGLLIPELRERLFQQLRGSVIQHLSEDIQEQAPSLRNAPEASAEDGEAPLMPSITALSGGIYVWCPEAGGFVPDTTCHTSIST